MELREIEDGARDLAEAIQEIMFAVETGQKERKETLKSRLKGALNLLRGSNCHITFREIRCIIRLDGTKTGIGHKLTDYCFVDPNSEEPRYHCEISAELVIDGRRGHPVPSKGDIKIDFHRVYPGREEDEGPTASLDDPLKGVEDRGFKNMLRDMGFDP